MKGKILVFNEEMQAGAIGTDNRQRLIFSMTDWQDVVPPELGMSVEFEVDANNRPRRVQMASDIVPATPAVLARQAAPASQMDLPSNALVFCTECGKRIHESAAVCPHCGAPQGRGAGGRNNGNGGAEKSKATATLLAAFLGAFGAHKFYMGSWGWGIIYLLFFWTSIPGLVGAIEFIRYVVLSEDEFRRKAAEMHGPFSFLW